MSKGSLVSAVMKVVDSRPNLERLMTLLYIEAKHGITEHTCPNIKKSYTLIYEVLEKYGHEPTKREKKLYSELK